MAADLSNIPDLGSRQLLAVLAIADYGSFIAHYAQGARANPAGIGISTLIRSVWWTDRD